MTDKDFDEQKEKEKEVKSKEELSESEASEETQDLSEEDLSEEDLSEAEKEPESEEILEVGAAFEYTEDEPKDSQKPEQPMSWQALMIRFIPTLVFFLAIALLMLYFLSPFSQVSQIDIQGNHDVFAQNILDQTSIKVGGSIPNIWRNREEFEQEIVEKIEQVKDADIEIQNYNEIVIHIDEFQTVAYLSEGNDYYRILENGVILDEPFDHSQGNQPTLSNFKEGRALDLMIEELEHLDQPILTLISEIEHSETDVNPLMIQVYMNGGNVVRASIPDFAKKMKYYPQMAETVGDQTGIFDLEAGAFFKPSTDQDHNIPEVNIQSPEEQDQN